MHVDGTPYRTIWPSSDGNAVEIIDQTLLPHVFRVVRLGDVAAVAEAIRSMRVRGAPLIGATAAYGIWLAMKDDPSDASLARASEVLVATRPTAINLRWAVSAMHRALAPLAARGRPSAARARADAIADEDVGLNASIGAHGLAVLRELVQRKAARGAGGPLQILTHCNAGWLATVDWGTATAAIYMAHAEGMDLHVWVDETRPRNQGASLTAWELGKAGVKHSLVVDNVGGHLMQHGLVDVVIVGTDRTTATGDVCNKVGTYLKALAARDCNVPFYVAAPSPSIDWTLGDGVRDIPIERRDPSEVTEVLGRGPAGTVEAVRICPPETPAINYSFDVTPARLVTGLITERGVASANREGLAALFPEHAEARA